MLMQLAWVGARTVTSAGIAMPCGVANFHTSMFLFYAVTPSVCTVVLSLYMQCMVYVHVNMS